MQCSPAAATQLPLYTWTVDRLVAGNQWRPELSVCVSASSNSTLVIPPNTLWYGVYRVNVTAMMTLGQSTQSLPATLAVSDPATTYLQVTPTPLISDIRTVGGTIEFSGNDTVSLDMSKTRDPDVAVGNVTGMHVYLFCYPQKAKDLYATKSFEELISLATNLANNRFRLIFSEVFHCSGVNPLGSWLSDIFKFEHLRH